MNGTEGQAIPFVRVLGVVDAHQDDGATGVRVQPSGSGRTLRGELQPDANEAAVVRDLSAYTPGDYEPGRGRLVRATWYVVSLVMFESGWFPVRRAKRWVLRAFGAKVGQGVVIKPHVRIKYPWRLELGDHCWIGQGAWIDNLAEVRIGAHACVSQEAYVCTGSHDHRRATFDLVTRPVTVEAGAWVAARATLLPGSEVGAGAVVPAGVVVRGRVEAGGMAGLETRGPLEEGDL